MTLQYFPFLFFLFSVLNISESCFKYREYDECGCMPPLLDLTLDSLEITLQGSSKNFTHGVINEVDVFFYGNVVNGTPSCTSFAFACENPENTLIAAYRDVVVFPTSQYYGWFNSNQGPIHCDQTTHQWWLKNGTGAPTETRLGCFKPNIHTTTPGIRK